jgi:hypothetical protein
MLNLKTGFYVIASDRIARRGTASGRRQLVHSVSAAASLTVTGSLRLRVRVGHARRPASLAARQCRRCGHVPLSKSLTVAAAVSCAFRVDLKLHKLPSPTTEECGQAATASRRRRRRRRGSLPVPGAAAADRAAVTVEADRPAGGCRAGRRPDGLRLPAACKRRRRGRQDQHRGRQAARTGTALTATAAAAARGHW